MKDKGRTRGTFKVYLQWPLFLSVLLVILTAAVHRNLCGRPLWEGYP